MASVDRDYYGDIHNMGHTFISYAHDPEHRHLESFGVMGDSATAIRDPGNQSPAINIFRNGSISSRFSVLSMAPIH